MKLSYINPDISPVLKMNVIQTLEGLNHDIGNISLTPDGADRVIWENPDVGKWGYCYVGRVTEYDNSINEHKDLI